MNPNCPDRLKKLVPLSKVVSASIIDIYEDIGKTQELHFHWAARGLKKLQSETLKSGVRRALIPVNKNTRTATLPPDFDTETFVGYINDYGEKVAIPLRQSLVTALSITEIPCVDTCEKCNQNKAICNDLTVTESVEPIVITTGNAVPNTVILEKTTIKKLYPDGSYCTEVTIPYWDIPTATVKYATTKECIAKIDLKDCGCIETTDKNIETIKACCYDAYCCYFAPCSDQYDKNIGGYKIFEEQGLIQFDFRFNKKELYLEYVGFIPKVNGEYAVPEVAFETLVEWTKFRSVEGKKNVTNTDKQWRWNMYTIARKAMVKSIARFSLDDIIHAISLTPKFDWTAPSWNNFCPVSSSEQVTTITSDVITGCDAAPACSTTATPVRTPFQLAIIVPNGIVSGLPIAGQTTFQNDFLIGALNVDYIIVNDMNESKNLGKFTFDAVTGTIDRNPNIWFAGDSLIVNFYKLV